MGLDTHDQQYSAETIDSVADGQMNAGQAVAVKQLENQIKQKILDAGEFSKADKDRWLAKVEKTNAQSSTELQSIVRDIDQERSIIEQMKLKYIGTVNQNREYFGKDSARKLDTAQQYIDEFNELGLEEKTKWMELLAGEIDGLKGLYETAKGLAPDAMDKFNTLRRSEKKEFLAQLKSSREGLKQLDEILSKNSAHLSTAEQEKLRVRMRDVPPEEQAKFLKEIVETEIKPREALTQKFRVFPAEFRKAFEGFPQMSRVEKEATLDTLVQNLGRAYRTELFDGALSKHFSEQSKEAAYTWFVQAPLENKVQALQMVKSQMKFEEAKSFEFEDMLSQFPSNTDQSKLMDMRRAFYESKYEDKVKKIEDLKKQLAKMSAESKESAPIEAEYEGRLDLALEEQDISETTHERDMARFKKLKLEDKKKDLEAFDARLKPRRELKERFQKEVSEDLQKEHGPEFYRRSHHGRMEKLNELLNIQKNKVSKAEGSEAANDNADATPGLEQGKTIEQMVQSLTLEASKAEGKDDYEAALDAYDKILVLDPENKFAAKRAGEMEKILAENEKNGELVDMTDSELEQMVRAAQNAERILEKRKLYTINHVLGETIKESDRKQNKHHAEDKTGHLGNSNFAQIQEQLADQHGMMLDSEGNAVQIQTIKLNDFKQKTDGEIHALGKQVATIQGNDDKRTKTHNFQAHDGQKVINGEEWAKRAEVEREQLDEAILKQAQGKLKKAGERIDEATVQKLTKKIQKSKQDVKLAA